jgi:hypothetical protein
MKRTDGPVIIPRVKIDVETDFCTYLSSPVEMLLSFLVAYTFIPIHSITHTAGSLNGSCRLLRPDPI